MPIEVRELTTPDEWRSVHAVMVQLRTELSVEEFLAVKPEMQSQGYRLFGLFDDGTPQALAGVAVLTNLYYGRHLFVYDLVTDERARSRGYGKLLLEHVEDVARSLGCGVSALSSGLQRLRAHDFYETKMGYERASWNFRKNL